jgi:hypothetical protein
MLIAQYLHCQRLITERYGEAPPAAQLPGIISVRIVEKGLSPTTIQTPSTRTKSAKPFGGPDTALAYSKIQKPDRAIFAVASLCYAKSARPKTSDSNRMVELLLGEAAGGKTNSHGPPINPTSRTPGKSSKSAFMTRAFSSKSIPSTILRMPVFSL